MILTIANQKGGVGKTTLTILLALALHKEYKDLILVDTDPQQSLYNNLINLNTKFTVIKDDVLSFVKNIEKYNNQLTIVDTLPSTDVTMVRLFNKSSLVLIPTGANLLDITASLNTIEVLEDLKIPYKVIFNNIKNINDLNSIKDIFKEKNINICENYITSRVAYSRLIQNNLEINDGKAEQEINNLLEEII